MDVPHNPTPMDASPPADGWLIQAEQHVTRQVIKHALIDPEGRLRGYYSRLGHVVDVLLEELVDAAFLELGEHRCILLLVPPEDGSGEPEV